MPPIDPRLVKAKRYPLHAAIYCCNLAEVQRLLTEDAAFHVVRKVPDLELSVLHSACSSRRRHLGPDIFRQIMDAVIKMGAPIEARDSKGQTAMHYAVCHHHDLHLVPLLIKAGAQLDQRRQPDGWTPLHLAAMLGKMEVVCMLLDAGAYPMPKDQQGQSPEDVAKSFGFHHLADLLHSPRLEFCPKSYPAEYSDLLLEQPPDGMVKLKVTETLIGWRDDEGNSLLHLAAWKGLIPLCRIFLDSIKGRQLVKVQNAKGAVPLAMAIISGKAQLVEEFFMHKFAKKLIDLNVCVNKSGENVVQLLIKYCPMVQPKFVLKRKDLDANCLNRLDDQGEGVLLYCARRRNAITVKQILSSKTVKEKGLLDFGIQSRKEGKTVLHYLVDSGDEANFANLLDRPELSEEVANLMDQNGQTALISCLLNGRSDMARAILEHPTAQNKFRLDLCRTPDQKSALHLIAEQGNSSLWKIAIQRPDLHLNARDGNGNTPLMLAAISSNTQILDAWIQDEQHRTSVDQTLVNDQGQTLFLLLVQHLKESEVQVIRTFLRKTDISSCINLTDQSGQTALLACSRMEKWLFLKEVLAITDQGLHQDQQGEDAGGSQPLIDIHTTDASGFTCLAALILARVKAARNEQTFLMKKQRSLAMGAKKEQERLWELIQKLLALEKQDHGPSVTQGRDGGSQCVQNQMAVSKLIRPVNVDEVVSAYTKQFQFVTRKRAPPAAKPEPVTHVAPTVPATNPEPVSDVVLEVPATNPEPVTESAPAVPAVEPEPVTHEASEAPAAKPEPVTHAGPAAAAQVASSSMELISVPNEMPPANLEGNPSEAKKCDEPDAAAGHKELETSEPIAEAEDLQENGADSMHSQEDDLREHINLDEAHLVQMSQPEWSFTDEQVVPELMSEEELPAANTNATVLDNPAVKQFNDEPHIHRDELKEDIPEKPEERAEKVSVGCQTEISSLWGCWCHCHTLNEAP